MGKKIDVKVDLGVDKVIDKIVGEAMNIIVFFGLGLPFINFQTLSFEFDANFFNDDKYLIFMLVIATINYLWHRQNDKRK